MDDEAEFALGRALPESRLDAVDLDGDPRAWAQADALVLSAGASARRLVEAERAGRLKGVRPPIIVLADGPSAEEAGLLMPLPIHDFLPLELDPADLARSLATAHPAGGKPRRAAGGVGELDPRYEALRHEAEKLAEALARMAAEQGGAPARAVDAARVRTHIKARRIRERFFQPGLFADPAWDILLDLSAARLEGRQVSVSSLCIAAAVPTTTALRWIKKLCDLGMLARLPDPEDARRAYIVMTEDTAARMKDCLEATFNLGGA